MPLNILWLLLNCESLRSNLHLMNLFMSELTLESIMNVFLYILILSSLMFF